MPPKTIRKSETAEEKRLIHILSFESVSVVLSDRLWVGRARQLFAGSARTVGNRDLDKLLLLHVFPFIPVICDFTPLNAATFCKMVDGIFLLFARLL